MPQKGILRNKREELEALGAISARPDPELVRLIEAGDSQAIRAHYQVIQHWVDQILRLRLGKCIQNIGRHDIWAQLSDRPAEFNAHLDKTLKCIERCLKLIHQIPDHRPTTEALRDQRLEELQQEFPEASWGEIAIKYNARFAKEASDRIDAKIAHQAVTRLKNRRAKYQQDIVSQSIKAAESSLKTASLTDEEVLPRLPTPQDILELLVSE
jgi:nucleotidyltransferase/DNA polymerase involved in DNA repair